MLTFRSRSEKSVLSKSCGSSDAADPQPTKQSPRPRPKHRDRRGEGACDGADQHLQRRRRKTGNDRSIARLISNLLPFTRDVGKLNMPAISMERLTWAR